ncbi:MAG: PH domain-containing protein, partial [Methanobacteriota archaeon]
LVHLVFGLVLLIVGYLNLISSAFPELSTYIVALGALLLFIPIIHGKLHEMTTLAYTTDDNFIVYEKGIINHEKKKINMANITDTAITSSLGERLVNVSTLKINTGGSLGYEAVIGDLDSAEAEELHDFILKKKSTKGESFKHN